MRKRHRTKRTLESSHKFGVAFSGSQVRRTVHRQVPRRVAAGGFISRSLQFGNAALLRME